MSAPVPAWFFNQSAVIPYRIKGGRVEIALITSIKRRRWIVPKGVIDPGETAAGSAQREAREEAGLAGRISDEPIGRYRYGKWKGTCDVEVYLLEVTEALDDWPERDQRDRSWVSVEEAARRIEEPDLRSLVRAVPGLVGHAAL